MASRDLSSVTRAITSIEQAGFHIVKDTGDETNEAKEGDTGRKDGKGRRFARFYNNGYRTKTPEGLEFVYQNIIGDRVRMISSLRRHCLTRDRKLGPSFCPSSSSLVGDIYDFSAHDFLPTLHGFSTIGTKRKGTKQYTLSWYSFGCRAPESSFMKARSYSSSMPRKIRIITVS